MSSGHGARLEKIERYYADKLTLHGASPQGVDWRDEKSQTRRFAVLAEALGPDGQVCEMGCGYGALAQWLRASGYSHRYVGIDLSADMVEAARTACAGLGGVRFDVGSAAVEADYILSSGLFNVRLDHSEDAWWSYVAATLDDMWSMSRVAMAFNCLTSFADADRREERLWYPLPGKLLDWCAERFGRHVACRQDYGLWEFTIVVRRKPEEPI